jgi:hypothetical protein
LLEQEEMPTMKAANVATAIKEVERLNAAMRIAFSGRMECGFCESAL